MTIFRPCIDLHNGQVKQIVGATLIEGQGPSTNFVAEHDASFYATLYRAHQLWGGHVIKLGPGNDHAALSALSAWPDGLHLGGGITIHNAGSWLDAGAQKVIVTSALFDGDSLDMTRVKALSAAVGPDRLVIDLSCKRTRDGWQVATNHWQTVTATKVNRSTLEQLADYCSEYLIHAADVEGKCQGIDEALVEKLGTFCPIVCTYAGGGRQIEDLALVNRLSDGRVDLTFGSALDLFGGRGVRFADAVAWNRSQHRFNPA